MSRHTLAQEPIPTSWMSSSVTRGGKICTDFTELTSANSRLCRSSAKKLSENRQRLVAYQSGHKTRESVHKSLSATSSGTSQVALGKGFLDLVKGFDLDPAGALAAQTPSVKTPGSLRPPKRPVVSRTPQQNLGPHTNAFIPVSAIRLAILELCVALSMSWDAAIFHQTR